MNSRLKRTITEHSRPKAAVGVASFVLTKPITLLLDYLFKVRTRTSLPCFAMRSKG